MCLRKMLFPLAQSKAKSMKGDYLSFVRLEAESEAKLEANEGFPKIG